VSSHHRDAALARRKTGQDIDLFLAWPRLLLATLAIPSTLHRRRDVPTNRRKCDRDVKREMDRFNTIEALVAAEQTLGSLNSLDGTDHVRRKLMSRK
jgi:hypothetical protein